MHVPADATVAPFVQLPPEAMEKVPPARPTLLTVGEFVNLIEPLAVLVTVMVPECVVVVPVTREGFGAENVKFAPVPLSDTEAGVTVAPV